MNTHTHKPRPVHAIRYSEETERQIIEALGATSVNKITDPAKREHHDRLDCGPVFTATVGPTGRRTKVPKGDYSFNTGDYLVLCDGGFDGEWEGIEGSEDAKGAKVLHPARFHRLYQ